MQILFIGIPFLAVYNTYSFVLRGMGDSGAPFFSVLVCSGVNIALDLVLVAVFRYGSAGAAAATALSQASMAVFVAAYTFRRYPMLRFRFGRAADRHVRSERRYGRDWNGLFPLDRELLCGLWAGDGRARVPGGRG